MIATTPRLKPRIEGRSDGETIFFVQGWPDDHTLWDELVAALRDRYRCVRVDMPNYGDGERRRWGFTHAQIVEALVRTVREVSPWKPVTLVAHDWGAFWAYLLHHNHPELVSRLVGLDVGPDLKPTPREAAFIVGYQWWLLSAFVIGGPVGDWMTRRFARIMHAPLGSSVRAEMNYPYLYTWRDIASGRAATALRGYAPRVPLMFVYGEKKPGQFHTARWLEKVLKEPTNEVVALPNSGHWVTRDPSFNERVRGWLERTDARLAAHA